MLGEAVALLRDMLNPDDLVVGGQAFTEYPEGMAGSRPPIASARCCRRATSGSPSFGNRVQEAGAGLVSLGGLYADPIGAMRRARSAGPPADAALPPKSTIAEASAVRRGVGIRQDLFG